MHSLLSVIQQRKLDRVAAAYGVAAWIFVQAASIALPTFGAPGWVMKIIIVAAVAGFPLALWMTWHATEPVHAPDADGSPPVRRGDYVLVGLLTLVILALGVEMAFQMGALPHGGRVAPSAPTPGPTRPPVSIASIAVLPFLNLSGDSRKEFFSDGIAEELLNDLANARNLRVAARTSSFAFKGKSEDIRQIARALNVRSILEGSVREDGQHIRITAQLIDASNGYHLWSKTYNRDLSNILQVQDEIAQAITGALIRTLGVAPSLPRRVAPSPIDPNAYRDYLKAQALEALKTEEGDAQAVALFKSVTAREPKFAPAFAALGRTYAHMAAFDSHRRELLQDGELVTKRALRLDPKNLEALSTALYIASLQWNWSAASRDAKALMSINPHNVFTLRGLYYYYAFLGFPEQRTAVIREITRLDPLSFVDLNNLAAAYADRGRYVEAASAAADALTVKSDRPLALYTLCRAYAGMKRADKSKAIAVKLMAANQNDAADGCAFAVAIAAGEIGEGHRLATRIAGRFPAFAFDEGDIGLFYAATRDYTAARVWFQRAYEARVPSLFSLAYTPSTPPEVLHTPWWKALMMRPEARAWQVAHNRVSEDLAQN